MNASKIVKRFFQYFEETLGIPIPKNWEVGAFVNRNRKFTKGTYHGILVWKEDGWFIDGHDRVHVGEEIEIKQTDESWIKIKVWKDANEVFCSEPGGVPLDTGMVVRRKS